MTDKRMIVALQLRKAIELLVQTVPLDETEALAIPDLYEPWAEGKEYAPGKIVTCGTDDNGDTVLYTVLQAHTSAENWPPGDTPALYKRVGFTDSGVPLWVQPLGAVDAYDKGDTVSHNGFIWVSDVDGNVWEPGVYGWHKRE
jgi:hypothetical protein